MEILNVTPIQGFTVATDDDELFSYTRYGADCWYVNMGESDEPVYDCKEIEAKFQEYIKSENIGV
jgi:hypothetical protein